MQQPVEVFRAGDRRACDERAFMLTAVGIDSQVDVGADGYVLYVEHVVREHALHHLWQYEQERQQRPSVPTTFTPLRGAWRGSLAYALVILLPPLVLAQGWLNADPYEAATLRPELVRSGEWWRAVTALTLHWDAAHLLGNLGSGGLLGYSAAQIWGSARAWLLIVVAAVTANLAESAIGFTHYVSAGASTAVFAALGLIAAFAWRTRGQRFGSSWARWGPLVAGVALLGFFGAGSGEPVAGLPMREVLPFEEQGSTNVLSHLLGFASGVLAGVVAATAWGAARLRALPTWCAVLLPVGLVAVAWALALRAVVVSP